MSSYVRVIGVDFLATATVNLSELTYLVNNNSNITKVLTNITQSVNNITFTFAVALSGTDITALNSFVATYVPDTNYTITYTSAGSNVTNIVYDSKASGTSGGTFTAGTFAVRVLNTVTGTNIFASVATNIITIPAGTYFIRAFAPGYKCNAHKAQLFNNTANASIAYGQNCTSNSADNTVTHSNLFTFLTISTSTAITLRHRCGTTRTTDGLGLANGFAVEEIYAVVEITKYF